MDIEFSNKIKDDFSKVCKMLKVYSMAITGKYEDPVFIMSFEDLQIPFPTIITTGEMDNKANYYAAYLGALQEMKIIEKAALFKEHYKNPNAFCCILYMDSKKNNNVNSIVYIPYENK